MINDGQNEIEFNLQNNDKQIEDKNEENNEKQLAICLNNNLDQNEGNLRVSNLLI